MNDMAVCEAALKYTPDKRETIVRTLRERSSWILVHFASEELIGSCMQAAAAAAFGCCWTAEMPCLRTWKDGRAMSDRVVVLMLPKSSVTWDEVAEHFGITDAMDGADVLIVSEGYTELLMDTFMKLVNDDGFKPEDN